MGTSNEKICWGCKRIIVGKSTLGLCPSCVNKYGTPAAAVAALLFVGGGRVAIKNKDKIINAVIKMIKH